MRSSIHLPVVEKLQVSNYPLYPGSSKQGLSLAFSPGVTVIAGVNGIGKTTLLNLLLRMLLGASNPSKAASRDIGKASQRTLIPDKKFSFFADRVPNLPSTASATLTFSIGRTRVVIKRHLSDMSIIKASIGKQSLGEIDNPGFLTRMAELSGLSSSYDYHIVIRFVQFFTEERLPLLWSASSQVELFKMLFAEQATMAGLNELYKAIQKTDSDFRNRTYQRNDRIKSQKKVAAALGLDRTGVEEVRKDLEDLRKALERVDKELIAANSDVRSLSSRREQTRNDLDDLQNQLDTEVHAFHQLDAGYISQILPGQHDKRDMLMQGLGSNLGCFVCGKSGKKELAAINKRIKDHHCFVCNSRLPEDRNAAPPAERQAVLAAEAHIEALISQIEAHKVAQIQHGEQYAAALDAVRPLAAKRNELVNRLEEIAIQWPNEVMAGSSGDSSELAAEQLALDELKLHRSRLNQKYAARITELSNQMARLESDLGERLTSYAQEFLHETVRVEFSRNAALRIATGVVPVKVPTFRISMTSSTHLATHERANPTSVSESQKEFLDLAFRMTLLDLIGADDGTMLVMETPEASLDSWFMERAAKMIHRFAKQDGKSKLIATSNVNGTTMIRDLLGLKKGAKLPADQSQRFINLMDLAAEPGALKQSGARAALSKEVKGYIDG